MRFSFIKLLLFLSVFSYTVFGKNLQVSHLKVNNGAIKLFPLIKHNNTPSAGCFIQDRKGNVYAQLHSLNGYYFNLTGFEEQFEELIDKKLIPKGYSYGFQKKDISIFVKEIALKKEGCITTTRYVIMIKANKANTWRILWMLNYC